MKSRDHGPQERDLTAQGPGLTGELAVLILDAAQGLTGNADALHEEAEHFLASVRRE